MLMIVQQFVFDLFYNLLLDLFMICLCTYRNIVCYNLDKIE